MAHLTASVEYSIHCLLWLVDAGNKPLSSRDLAELQGISPSFVAKLFPKLEKAGIVTASEGVRGGYVLARPPEEITFLQIIDAIEGFKPLFECQEIRNRIALFGDTPPAWAMEGLCSIHTVMIKAEEAMRAELAAHTLANVAVAMVRKAPAGFKIEIQEWMDGRVGGRRPGRSAKKDTAPS